MTTLPSARLRRHVLLLAAAVVVATLGALAPTTSAHAVDLHARTALPVRAGSSLTMVGAHVGPQTAPTSYCTAGPVLRPTGIFSQLTEYQRAVRYVVTAKHCGHLHQSVRVGGTDIGTVSWESSDADFALIRVDPTVTRSTLCSSTSAGPRCSIFTRATPRAVGQVIAGGNRVGQETSIPVTGSGVPAEREIYCVSGNSSGAVCAFRRIPPPAGLPVAPHEVTSETFGRNMVDGDSGGPVFSRAGRIYGVHVAGGTPNGEDPTIEAYVPIGRILQELPRYALVTG